MNRRRRTEILIQGDSELAQTFARSIIRKYECKKIIGPHYGLTMIKVRESAKNSLFYIGEILITEAKVSINDCIGTGVAAGMRKELAEHLAVVDAAYGAGLPETVEWEPELMAAEKKMKKKRAAHQAELFHTKVSFETMDS